MEDRPRSLSGSLSQETTGTSSRSPTWLETVANQSKKSFTDLDGNSVHAKQDQYEAVWIGALALQCEEMFWPRANAKVAAPVIPGRLRRTPQWCSGTFGPAPTRLMSPSSTFSSCGSSSSFHLRRNNPIQVNCSLLFVATAERAASTR
jgi:hypothetical protein